MELRTCDLNLIIETLRRNEFSGSKIHEIITRAWGDRISVRRVQQIMNEYKEQHRTNFDRIDGSGRPKSDKRVELIPLVSEELRVNARLTCYELAEMFETNHNLIHKIITEDLDLISVQDKWVPHKLSPANKEARVACCNEIIQSFTRRNIHRYLLVTDEKWFYCRPIGCPQTRRSWISVDEAGDRGEIAKRKTVDQKFMAIVAVNLDGLSFFTVLQRNQSVNSELYTRFLDEAVDSFSTHNLQSQRRAITWENMILMHDNAKPHTSHHTTDFLTDKNVRLLHQAPYSPDLNMCDRMIFPMLEMKRTKRELHTIEALQTYLNETLTNLTPATMRKEGAKLVEHCERVIEAGGSYV